MNASSNATLLKLVLPASISNLAVYSLAIMPVIILRVCNWGEPFFPNMGCLFKLQALKNYLELLLKCHINPKIKIPQHVPQLQSQNLSAKVPTLHKRLFTNSSFMLTSSTFFHQWFWKAPFSPITTQ